ncbi:MAG: hypothetical protein AB4911_01775 [Oscillochloridaceae bacterium umkhey_bin13]
MHNLPIPQTASYSSTDPIQAWRQITLMWLNRILLLVVVPLLGLSLLNQLGHAQTLNAMMHGGLILLVLGLVMSRPADPQRRADAMLVAWLLISLGSLLLLGSLSLALGLLLMSTVLATLLREARFASAIGGLGLVGSSLILGSGTPPSR